MAQTWTANCYQADHEVQTDVGNMETNFSTLLTLFSGATAPGTMAACHPWFDTAQHVLKVRNDGDSAWVGLMHGDTSQKMWVYRDSAMSGWAVDGTPTDRILAIKGGSTYTTGGAGAGSWTQANHNHTGPSHTHVHNHTHELDSSIVGGSAYAADGYVGNIAGQDQMRTRGAGAQQFYVFEKTIASSGGSTDASGTGLTGGSATVNTYRPAASVGTLQYLDL